MKRAADRPVELSQLFGSMKAELGMLVLASAASNLIMVVPILYMLQIYDRVLVSMNTTTLVSVSLLLGSLFAVFYLAEWVRSSALIRIGTRIDDAWSAPVFKAMLDQRSPASKDTVGRPLFDLIELRQFITGSGAYAVLDTPWTPVYVLILYLMHPWLGAAAALMLAFQLVLVSISQRLAASEKLVVKEQETSYLNQFQRTIKGVDAAEAMGMSAPMQRRWLEAYREAGLEAGASGRREDAMGAFSKWTRYTQQSVALGLGALLVLDEQITPGAMIASNFLMTRALAPVDQLVGIRSQIGHALEAYRRLSSGLRRLPADVPKAALSSPTGFRLLLEGVHVAAPGQDRDVLHNIHLAFEPGQVYGVLGPTGSGKSTLAKTLLGIWPVKAGRLGLNGQPLSDWSAESLGRFFGYMPQKTELFRATVAENIARLEEVDPEAVVRAADAADLHRLILRLPQGYDTVVGEGGFPLSGGQIQRLALARALYRDPSLLVLDEPNANLDEQGEAALERAITGLRLAGKTVVIISHRTGIMKIADQLIMLRNGAVERAGVRDAVLLSMQKEAVTGSGLPLPTAH